jgi:hypothetical protein
MATVIPGIPEARAANRQNESEQPHVECDARILVATKARFGNRASVELLSSRRRCLFAP